MEDLRCPSRLHGKIVDGLLETKCTSSHCGAGRGAVVLHYFDINTGLLVKTQRFQEPQRLFKKEK